MDQFIPFLVLNMSPKARIPSSLTAFWSPIHKKGWVPFGAYTGQDFYFIRKEDMIVVWPEVKWSWSQMVNRKWNYNNSCSKMGILKFRLRVPYFNWIQTNKEYVLISLKKKMFCLILRSDTFFFLKTDMILTVSFQHCVADWGWDYPCWYWHSTFKDKWMENSYSVASVFTQAL